MTSKTTAKTRKRVRASDSLGIQVVLKREPRIYAQAPLEFFYKGIYVSEFDAVVPWLVTPEELLLYLPEGSVRISNVSQNLSMKFTLLGVTADYNFDFSFGKERRLVRICYWNRDQKSYKKTYALFARSLRKNLGKPSFDIPERKIWSDRQIRIRNEYYNEYKKTIPSSGMHEFEISQWNLWEQDKPDYKLHATLCFDTIQKYIRLFHAFSAVHDRCTHDEDSLVIQDEERKLEFSFQAAVSYVRIGPIGADENNSYWVNNIPHEDVFRLLVSFLYRRYEEIAMYKKWYNKKCCLE